MANALAHCNGAIGALLATAFDYGLSSTYTHTSQSQSVCLRLPVSACLLALETLLPEQVEPAEQAKPAVDDSHSIVTTTTVH